MSISEDEGPTVISGFGGETETDTDDAADGGDIEKLKFGLRRGTTESTDTGTRVAAIELAATLGLKTELDDDDTDNGNGNETETGTVTDLESEMEGEDGESLETDLILSAKLGQILLRQNEDLRQRLSTVELANTELTDILEVNLDQVKLLEKRCVYRSDRLCQCK